jgi:hypothetical protein
MILIWRMRVPSHKWADEWVRKGVGPDGIHECARADYAAWKVQGGALDMSMPN